MTQQGAIELRDRMGNLLFDHKESMNENTYKLLYEALAVPTEEVDKVWCVVRYGKATVTDGTARVGKIPHLQIHRRNVLLSREIIDKAEVELRRNPSLCFESVWPSYDCYDLRLELDEPDLYNHNKASFRLISISPLFSQVPQIPQIAQVPQVSSRSSSLARVLEVLDERNVHSETEI